MGRIKGWRLRPNRNAGFTLTELLVVIGVLALLLAIRLPAFTKIRSPVKDTRCLSNCRQLGTAVLLYREENEDSFPFGIRVLGAGTGSSSVIDPNGWPMQLLPYLGGYVPNKQPKVFMCPNERRTAPDWVFQLHYQASRHLISDFSDLPAPVRGFQVREPSRYWVFIEKDPVAIANVRSGGLAIDLSGWNIAPGFPGRWRHNGAMNSVAADGHVETLMTPPYKPGDPRPTNWLELGDCSNGFNPASTWVDNTNIVKLFSRAFQGGGGVSF